MKSVVVVYLKKDSLEVFRVVGGKKTARGEAKWDTENLRERLRLVKERFEAESVRILVARELVGIKAVLDMLAEAAVAAGLKIETVEDESLVEVEGRDRVVELAEKDLEKGEEVARMVTEVVPMETKREEREKGNLKEQSEGGKNKKRVLKKNYLWVALAGFVLVGLGGGGVWWAKSLKREPTQPEVVAPSPTVTSTPSPTPRPVKLTEIEVRVLNGSGVTGRAAEVKELLTGVGFAEEKVKIGNADNYNYEGVEVRLKTEVGQGVYEAIKAELESEYRVEKGENLAKESEDEVVVIVGAKE